jgi:hypothetical protein
MRYIVFLLLSATTALVTAAEFHVAPAGNDAAAGTVAAPLKSICAAASRAQPGDTVTVHAGTYRERVNPPRGGTGEDARITYQAAPGETVLVKGSEPVTGWTHSGGDTWQLILPNGFFGAFNPFNNLLGGDWFDGKGRNHHAGAVYLNGDWLAEAAAKATVLQPASGTPQWFAEVDGGGSLLNVAWLQPRAGTTPGTRVDASWFARDFGVTIATCSEGGQCVGWIEHGDWTRHDNVEFGTDADSLQLRVAAGAVGGVIEVRLDGAAGTLLGSVAVPATGGWQTWTTVTAAITPTSGARSVCLVYRSPVYAAGSTTIWAQFPGTDPNTGNVEINARQSVFYPDEPGLDFITVRGFTLEQAATPWAPPTAEQIGLLGTHWGKNWLIENNTIRYSVCAGIALGKYGDRYDNTAGTSPNSSLAYIETIQRALSNDWRKDGTGGHTVRGNHISHCEQAGIVGSLGGAFCTISGNHIHDIHVRQLFSGAEMAGIKLHGAIDTQILNNHIHHCVRGIWLDWMAQGTRVSGNLLHDNNSTQDLFLEVDHGPLLIDHNLFLSAAAVWDSSQGEAYVHNLIAGTIQFDPDQIRRDTPYHPAHDTAIAGLAKINGGDTRFYNNILTGAASLAGYDNAAYPVAMAGNVFLQGAGTSTRESAPLVLPAFEPAIRLTPGAGGYYLEMNLDPAWKSALTRPLATTALLGNAVVPGVPFEQPDGTPWRLATDYFGKARDAANPFPGPFENPLAGANVWKVSTAATALPVATAGLQRLHVDINGGQTPGTAGNFSGTPATVLGEAGDVWNTLTPGYQASGGATALLNAAGEPTTMSLSWTPNHWSFDNSTAAAAYQDLLGDYAYVYAGGQSSATWTISGLAAYATYNLVVYAATGTAGGKWTVNGTTKEAAPSAGAATLTEGNQFVRFGGVRANGYGQLALVLAIRAGQSYGEMAGLELETVAFADIPPLSISQAGFSDSAFAITATGLDPSCRYVLTRSADLTDGFPLVMGPAFTPAGPTAVLTDPAPPPGSAFYRLELLP